MIVVSLVWRMEMREQFLVSNALVQIHRTKFLCLHILELQSTICLIVDEDEIKLNYEIDHIET